MLPWLLALLTVAAALLAAPVVGAHLAAVVTGRPQPRWDRWLGPVEERLLRWIGAHPQAASAEAGVWAYLGPLLIANLAAGALALALLCWQPPWLNPSHFPGLRWDLALHTTLSFLTNTDQQHLRPETSLGTMAQLGALQFLMHVSAATGLAVGFAVIRGFSGLPLGQPQRDLLRALTRILLPGSVVLALLLLLAGVPMTLQPPLAVQTLAGSLQWLPRGPIALFEAIKLLGQNGGGFLAANSSHPYENPSLFTDLLETWAMLLLPLATIEAFGRVLGDRRQARGLMWLVLMLLAAGAVLAMAAEQAGNPALASWLSGPNLEGKELRFGAVLSGFWAAVSTGTMTGATNGSFEALMPTSVLIALFNLLLQVVGGAQGLGIALLLVFVLLSVFLAGLMVGRTPTYLGRRLDQPQVMWASLVLLIHPLVVLVPVAITLAQAAPLAAVQGADSHALTQVAYEYASAAANNGSGLEGLADGSRWWNLSTSLSLVGGRYLPIAALLALADGFRRQPLLEAGPGMLRTDTPLFLGLTAAVILILGALTFLPLLALGPLAELLGQAG